MPLSTKADGNLNQRMRSAPWHEEAIYALTGISKMTSTLLSKSHYLNGLQCPKYLWILFNEPESIPEVDAVTQYRFDQGHLVGELAKKLFSNGIDIPDEDFTDNLRQTRELLEQRVPLFEAGIKAGEIYARADILNPVGANEWDIIEVKSSTSVKDENYDDVSFHKLCYKKHGLKIRKSFLAYINNEYVKHGDIDPKQLFNIEDISDRVEEASPETQKRIGDMLDIISAERCPDITIGKHCKEPYDCPLQQECWCFLPENSVFDLYRGGKKSFELFENGVLAIKNIPDCFKLTGVQQIQKECEIRGDPYIDRVGISRFLRTLKHSLYYLDFETFSPVVPLFDGTKPYQKIPFQFSLHSVEKEQAKPSHYSFLAECTDDPRPELLSQLEKVLGEQGSIIVYNQAFEKGILKELAEAFPDYSGWVEDVLERIVDLLVPFRSFYYYHPAQKGSASIKMVLPALTGKSYEEMDISNGEDASLAFLEVTYSDVPEEIRMKIRGDLEKYCGLDTEGMIRIVDRLREIA
jgi:hypothetical protein